MLVLALISFDPPKRPVETEHGIQQIVKDLCKRSRITRKPLRRPINSKRVFWKVCRLTRRRRDQFAYRVANNFSLPPRFSISTSHPHCKNYFKKFVTLFTPEKKPLATYRLGPGISPQIT